MTAEEASRVTDLGTMFLIKPAFPPLYDEIRYAGPENPCPGGVVRPYISADEPFMSVEAIKKYLISNHVFQDLEV